MASLVASIVYRSRTVASEILQTTKTKAVYLTGVFYSFINKAYTETVNLTEILSQLFGKNVEDQFNLSDFDDISFDKNASDPLNIADVLDRSVQFSRTIADQTSIADSGTVSIQTYIGTGDYFLNDYVGISRIFP
jgi:hypothetical protein